MYRRKLGRRLLAGDRRARCRHRATMRSSRERRTTRTHGLCSPVDRVVVLDRARSPREVQQRAANEPRSLDCGCNRNGAPSEWFSREWRPSSSFIPRMDGPTGSCRKLDKPTGSLFRSEQSGVSERILYLPDYCVSRTFHRFFNLARIAPTSERFAGRD